ncbi:uncharacterized protein [Rutidosis leptorrhynchoides]|uniref:uncharacterized protein isoform X3 n=1 Tax=Rutidosis leptorrhynchoides TaxID=125765 RepID=UPI003A9926A2
MSKRGYYYLLKVGRKLWMKSNGLKESVCCKTSTSSKKKRVPCPYVCATFNEHQDTKCQRRTVVQTMRAMTMNMTKLKLCVYHIDMGLEKSKHL